MNGLETSHVYSMCLKKLVKEAHFHTVALCTQCMQWGDEPSGLIPRGVYFETASSPYFCEKLPALYSRVDTTPDNF